MLQSKLLLLWRKIFPNWFEKHLGSYLILNIKTVTQLNHLQIKYLLLIFGQFYFHACKQCILITIYNLVLYYPHTHMIFLPPCFIFSFFVINELLVLPVVMLTDLAGLIVYMACAGNNGCSKFISATIITCPKDIIL